MCTTWTWAFILPLCRPIGFAILASLSLWYGLINLYHMGFSSDNPHSCCFTQYVVGITLHNPKLWGLNKHVLTHISCNYFFTQFIRWSHSYSYWDGMHMHYLGIWPCSRWWLLLSSRQTALLSLHSHLLYHYGKHPSNLCLLTSRGLEVSLTSWSMCLTLDKA